MRCTPSLMHYDQITQLQYFIYDNYPDLKLTSKNKEDFENRNYESYFCEKLIRTMMDNIYTDPIDVLFECSMALEYESTLFNHNEKRQTNIERLIFIIMKLENELKKY